MLTVNGLVGKVILAVLYQLLKLFYALLGDFHAAADSVRFLVDRGNGSVQLGKVIDCL